MAAFDPIAAGGVPFDPNAAGGTPVPSSGFAPLTPSPAAPGMVAGGGFAAGNPPGFDATTTAAAEQQKGMTTRAQSYANDMFPLFKAQQQLAIAPTGKGTDTGYDMSALLQTRTPEWFQRAAAFGSHLLPGVANIMTPEELNAYAETNKYFTQGTIGFPGATRSNEGGQAAAAATPSVTMPKEAAQAVLQNMIGLRRMEQDQTMQWQQSGMQLRDLPAFVSRFQTNADPRVYIWDQFTPPQQKQLLAKMSPAQQRSFIDKVERADANGLYNTMGMGASQ